MDRERERERETETEIRGERESGRAGEREREGERGGEGERDGERDGGREGSDAEAQKGTVVDESNPAVREQQEVPGVWVGVEEAVYEQLVAVDPHERLHDPRRVRRQHGLVPRHRCPAQVAVCQRSTADRGQVYVRDM